MLTLSISRARANLFGLVKRIIRSHEPVTITGKHGNAILLAEEDWRALQETVYLLSVPGMRESVREGLATPVEDCSDEPGW